MTFRAIEDYSWCGVTWELVSEGTTEDNPVATYCILEEDRPRFGPHRDLGMSREVLLRHTNINHSPQKGGTSW